MSEKTEEIIIDSDSESFDEIDNYFNNTTKNINDSEDNEINKTSNKNNDIIIGIDLGTTNSCVSIWRNNNLEIIPDSFGNKTIPSVVAYTNKTKYIGKSAKNQIDLNPENTFYEIKRFIGRKFDDESVKNDLPFLSYNLTKGDNDNIILKSDIKNRKNNYTPEEISAQVLMEIKHMAEDYLNTEIKKAVITTPAYFNDSQREATIDASTIAGLECVRIINEPTAAALAYGLEKKSTVKDKDINVIVYDLGGGTLDVSLLNICDGVFEVLASTGNTHLGGADFDNRLVNYCISYFKKKNNIVKIDSVSSMSLQKLKKSCENAKKVLSVTWKAIIAVKDFYDDKNLYITLTRDNFEKICKDLFILCLKPVEDVLKSCEMDREDIDEIILVGGGTRMPTIRENLRLFFRGKEPNSTVNPDEVVAAGAAIQGYIVANQSDPFSENVVLLDVIPLSLGVEVIGGVMDVLIPRNSVIPIKRKRKYTTDSDYQTEVEIQVFEGERKMSKDNFCIGNFILQGIESAPRGVARIEVTFSVDINGIISVTAEDLDNNQNKNNIIISGNKNRLSPNKIKKLVEEAKDMEIRDKISRQKKQSYYRIEDLCTNVITNINNDEFKLKDSDKEIILNDVNKVLQWLESKHFIDHDKKEYLDKLERLNKKYATLILKITHETDNVKAGNKGMDGIEATSVFSNDDDDEDDVYERIENDELGLDNEANDELKKEVKQLRETVVDMCYNIFDVVSSDSLKLKDKDREELKDYINDTLLWVHVEEKISKSQYKSKIEEINKFCNSILEKYNDDNIFDDNSMVINSKRDELEQLCYALKSSIVSNLFSVKEDKIKELDDKINNIFDWLIEIDIKLKKCELDNTSFDINENDYQIKINELNNLCENLYNTMINLDSSSLKEDIVDNDEIPVVVDNNIDNNMGTSIFNLRNKQK